MTDRSRSIEALLSEPDLIRIMSSRTPYDQRKAALERFMTRAWQAGWDAHGEEMDAAMGRFLARDYGIPQ